MATSNPDKALYEPTLDGLRLVAFLSVFLHHMPFLGGSRIVVAFKDYGWIGVELFFVISSYLFFRLLDNEYKKFKSINIRNFFIRRFLRIYPLMIAFSLAMILLFNGFSKPALLRLFAIATFTDNILTWFTGYSAEIKYTSHLWTLAFEFQVYLLIPAAFLAWKRYGTARFLAGLSSVYLMLFSARIIVTYFGVRHPIVWVTPYLQPESVLIGMVLATGVFRRVPALAWPAVFGIALWAFLKTPLPWDGVVPAAQSYPYAAVACLALVESARNIRPLSAILTFRPVVFLGTISFGMYVFHIFAIFQSEIWLRYLFVPFEPTISLPDYVLTGVLALAVTIALSAISYLVLEAPFLRFKFKFEAVHGREAPSSHLSPPAPMPPSSPSAPDDASFLPPLATLSGDSPSHRR